MSEEFHARMLGLKDAQCTGKKRFKNIFVAGTALIRWMEEQPNKVDLYDLSIYYCYHCDHWHMGSGLTGLIKKEIQLKNKEKQLNSIEQSATEEPLPGQTLLFVIEHGVIRESNIRRNKKAELRRASKRNKIRRRLFRVDERYIQGLVMYSPNYCNGDRDLLDYEV
jgi:hypothetical protein